MKTVELDQKNWVDEYKGEIDWVFHWVYGLPEPIRTEGHTHELERRNLPNISIRYIPQAAVGFVLNSVAIYMVENGALSAGDVVRLGGIEHVLVADKDHGGSPVLRMSWYKDPAAPLH